MDSSANRISATEFLNQLYVLCQRRADPSGTAVPERSTDDWLTYLDRYLPRIMLCIFGAPAELFEPAESVEINVKGWQDFWRTRETAWAEVVEDAEAEAREDPFAVWKLIDGGLRAREQYASRLLSELGYDIESDQFARVPSEPLEVADLIRLTHAINCVLLSASLATCGVEAASAAAGSGGDPLDAAFGKMFEFLRDVPPGFAVTFPWSANFWYGSDGNPAQPGAWALLSMTGWVESHLRLYPRLRASLSQLAGSQSPEDVRAVLRELLPGTVAEAWDAEWREAPGTKGIISRVAKLIEAEWASREFPLLSDGHATENEAYLPEEFALREEARREIASLPERARLTPAERDLFASLLDNPDAQSAEIGATLGIASSTVRVHQRNIRGKARRAGFA